MNVEILSRRFRASEKLRDFTEDKAIRLVSNHPEISHVVVVLIKRQGHLKSRSCELRFTLEGETFKVARDSDSFEESVLHVTNLVAQRLRRVP